MTSPSTICATTLGTACAQGLSLEEVAYYLGHVNADGTPSIQTTVRYTQAGREQVKARMRQIRNIEGGE